MPVDLAAVLARGFMPRASGDPKGRPLTSQTKIKNKEEDMTDEAKKEECCSSKKSCCCCASKLIISILAALLLFGAGYYVGKGCSAKVCPWTKQMMPVQK